MCRGGWGGDRRAWLLIGEFYRSCIYGMYNVETRVNRINSIDTISRPCKQKKGNNYSHVEVLVYVALKRLMPLPYSAPLDLNRAHSA